MAGPDESQLTKYRQAFNSLDKDGTGSIGTEELKCAIKVMGEDVPERGLKVSHQPVTVNIHCDKRVCP